MRRIASLAGLIAVLALALPAGAQVEPPRMVIEVSNQNPRVTEPVDFTVRFYDPEEPSRLFDPTDPDSLIEMHKSFEPDAPTVLPALARQSEGIYTLQFYFFGEGTWQVVALPAVADRTLLPPASTDQLTVSVHGEVGSGEDGFDWTGTIVLGVLIAGAVILAVLAGPWLRRPKGQPPAPPVQHDSWWASP